MSKAETGPHTSALRGQAFVLRVPGGGAAALVAHVNDGAISRHGSVQDAFLRIQTLLSPATPRILPDRRH